MIPRGEEALNHTSRAFHEFTVAGADITLDDGTYGSPSKLPRAFIMLSGTGTLVFNVLRHDGTAATETFSDVTLIEGLLMPCCGVSVDSTSTTVGKIVFFW